MEPGRVVLTALLVLSQLLSPLAANADDAKPVYQDTDSNGANYLANRYLEQTLYHIDEAHLIYPA